MTPDNTRARLLQLADVTPTDTRSTAEKRATDEFKRLVRILTVIADEKQHLYGLRRLDSDLAKGRFYNMMLVYGDVQRKFVRLEEDALRRFDQLTNDQLLETYGDLAVYAVRAMQIILRLEDPELACPTLSSPAPAVDLDDASTSGSSMPVGRCTQEDCPVHIPSGSSTQRSRQTSVDSVRLPDQSFPAGSTR